MSFNLDSLFIEWRAKVPTGIPNIKNAYHLVLLKEICLNKGIDTKIVDDVILTLEQDNSNKLDDKEREKAKKMGLVSKGFGNYGKDADSPTTHKVKNGKLVAVDDAQEDEPEDTSDKIPAQDFQSDPDKGGDYLKKKDDVEDVDAEDDGEESKQNISDENQKIVSDFESRVDKQKSDLGEKKSQIVNDSLDKIKTIYDDDASDEEKKDAAQWLVDNAGFATNENGKKAYLNKLGGDRKIISGDAGTKKSQDLVNKVSSLVELKTFNASGIKVGFSAAAKPDLGKENEVKPSQDEGVAQYFSSHKVLQKIRPNLHGLFGVKDENGKVKMPSSEHSKDYLAQSINNPALQNTINYAKEQIENGTVDEGVLNSLEDHQKRMQDVLNNYDIPSEEAANAIADSYNDLMVGLHKADDEIANSIMKQLAENNLYEQELANGEEVYLPSAGNFPAGDKIKGGTLEKVSLISCKFGKAGRTYGCPANSKTICELHQDESKQNNQGQYLGEDGHTLLINDDLIRGNDKSETKTKTQEFIKNTLNEVELGDTFSEDEVSKISTVVADYMEEIDKIKEEVKDETPVSRKWKLFGEKLKEIEKDYKSRLGDIITTEHASALIGENNAKNLVQSGGVKVEALMSAIEIANNIRTNESLNDLEHNKQFYDENGEPRFVTSKGTQNPNDYSITFRTKRTAGRTGGGCQLSFTGDGEPAPTQLTDDGQAINTETGEVRQV
tara:strand:+ start:1160 stop:3331 length:2172 start_codon:yes stop_codon:yes gene_type:complete